MKFYKVTNTTTKEEMFVKAESMDHILLYIIRNMTADWYFGVNIIEVNADKSRPAKGEFLMNAVRAYFVEVFNTDDDKAILNAEYASIVKAIKADRMIYAQGA